MTTIGITLSDLTFPANLKDDFCKFRPLISVKYRDSNDKIMFELVASFENGLNLVMIGI